jgi:hypothetical protein
VASRNISNSGIDVLNTSVTELMILGIFFVLLAFATARDDLKGASEIATNLHRKIDDQNIQISRLQAELKERKITVSMSKRELEETLFKRKIRISLLEMKNAKLLKAQEENKLQTSNMRTALIDAESERDILEKKLDTLTTAMGKDDSIEEIINSIKRIAAANFIDPKAPLKTVISSLEKKMGGLTKEAYDLREKLKIIMRKYNLKDDVDKQIDGEIRTSGCWKQKDRRARVYDALFKIFIRKDGFRVIPAWPKIRELDANSSSAISALINQRIVSEKQFRKFGKTIRKESESRPNPCIFVVNVEPDKSYEPSAFQYKKLRKVTGYFFYPR